MSCVSIVFLENPVVQEFNYMVISDSCEYNDKTSQGVNHYENISDAIKKVYDNTYPDEDYIVLVGFTEFCKDRLKSVLLTIDPNIIELLQSGQIKIILDNQGHGYWSITYYLYSDLIIPYNIDPSNIVHVTGCMTDKALTTISNYFGCEKIKTINFQYWEHSLSIIVQELNKHNSYTLQNKEYNKKFLAFNGRIFSRQNLCRHHLVKLMCAYNLDSLGHISYNVVNASIDSEHLLQQTIDYVPDSDKKVLKENKDSLLFDMMTIDEVSIRSDSEWYKKYSDCYIDQGPSFNCWSALSILDYGLYENTYFSIISEHISNSYDPIYNIPEDNILTEKTFRAIAFQHPFLIFSTVGILKSLRSLGYKTFNGIIDESYDDCEDDATRMSMIVHETKRLCNLNDDELSYFLYEAKKICEFNFQLLLTRVQ